MKTSNKYQEYAVLDAKIKALTEEKDELKTQIIEEMVGQDKDKEETPMGKFSISMLKTWKYTPKVTKLEEEFKAQKATEEENGDATFVEKPSLRFTQIKL